MFNIPYSYIEAKDEESLLEALLKLSASEGFTFKIISIYRKKNKVVAWYYASKRT